MPSISCMIMVLRINIDLMKISLIFLLICLNPMMVQGQIQQHENYVNSLEWSPNGEYLLSGSTDRTTKIWDNDGKLIDTKFLNGSVLDVKWISNEKFVTTDTEQFVLGWEINNDKPIFKFKRHNGYVKTIGIHLQPNSSDIRIISGGDGSNVYDYNWDTLDNNLGNNFNINNVIRDHNQTQLITTVGISSEGDRYFVGGYDGYLRIYELNGNNIIDMTSINLNEKIYSADISSDGNHIVISSENSINSYDINNFDDVKKIGEISQLKCTEGCLNADIKFNKDNTQIGLAVNKEILVYGWDNSTGFGEEILRLANSDLEYEDSMKIYAMDWGLEDQSIVFAIGADIYNYNLEGVELFSILGVIPEENSLIFYIGISLIFIFILYYIRKFIRRFVKN